MTTFYYLIDNDYIYLKSVKEYCYELPEYSDLSENQQEEANTSGQLFDVNDSDDKHYVINAKNIRNDNGLVAVAVRELITSWTSEQIHSVFKAMQVLTWRTSHQFCSRCGSRTRQIVTELAMVCDACHYRQYPRVQPCVIVAIKKNITNSDGTIQTKLLLAKDKRFKTDMQSVIAGFVEVGETLEAAVKREVKEETGLVVGNIQYLGSQPWAFPTNLMVAYSADYLGGEISLDDDELVHADFYDEKNLPNIPPKGTISHAMIQHVLFAKPFEI